MAERCASCGCKLWRSSAASSDRALLHLHVWPLIVHGTCLVLLSAMSSWLPESHKLQLAVTALASGCIAASAVIGLQNAKRWYSVHDLKGSIPELSSKHDVEKVTFGRYVMIQLTTNHLSDQRLRRRSPGRVCAKRRRQAKHCPGSPCASRRLR